MAEKIRLRRTHKSDLDFVLTAESAPDNWEYVGQWTEQQHLAALLNQDIAHLIIETTDSERLAGYVIIAGLTDSNQSVELRRIVITEKGQGYGRQTLELVKQIAFEEAGAHRLWLDVVEFNERARHLYESVGFQMEGKLREAVKYEKRGFVSLILMSMLRQEYKPAETEPATADQPKP